MAIGRHPLWGMTNDSDGLLEKAPGRFHVSLLTHHRVNQMAIPIDGAIQVAPFPFNIDVGFIHVPRSVCLPSSPGTQLICHDGGKSRLRVSNGLMRELEAPLQEHLGQIAQAQLVPKSPQHDEQDDIAGVFQIVEWGPRAFVKGSSAV